MTDEQILEFATKKLLYHYRPYQDPYWYGYKHHMIDFFKQIRKQTLEDMISILQDVPNPEAHRNAINRIKNELDRLWYI